MRKTPGLVDDSSTQFSGSMAMADGGKFWKGKMPPSSSMPMSKMAMEQKNLSVGNGNTPRGQMPMKTTGMARAKEVANSAAKGLFRMTGMPMARKAVLKLKDKVKSNPRYSMQ